VPIQNLDKTCLVIDSLSMNMAMTLQRIETLPKQILNELNDYTEFLIQKYGQPAKKPKAGCMQGTFIWMSDDFNAPLEDFRDYQ
jgi:hypothetical protein